MRPFPSALVLSLAASVSIAGCATWFNPAPHTQRATVVEYLYPKGEQPTLTPSIPELHLPLRVGIAFVPSERFDDLPETERDRLLNRVRDAFANRPYIAAIEIIPTAYLRPRGGFDNLEQAARMFNVDVVTLLSYDQVQFSDSNRLSVFYWTLIGGYIFNGSQYDVSTLVDASVFDVKSRSLLFRAPGTSQITGSSPLVNFAEASREARSEAYRRAIDVLIPRLDAQLEAFKVRVKDRQVARIVEKPGYSGGGALDPVALGLLGTGALLALAWRRRSA
ncbi:MAG TPA: rhombotarget lipoprotein [Zoogloea sp.]|uniref:rhombotarget lipoprotein n=1 Tax=Zoogloea sp. TaxID=49181 RepID=UPI002BE8B840|nr:rhombotarget lipoprotein [Zoogloea sp.]HMV17778.1 rhombotarget lipoprotein [Rhodocyclaceae bacterium]HMV63483.1 rhombotarget lipoprotein [Rhodocyclaceae bacterium]HMW52610.1 rhombotarget lipoprotein [Rhodocyclaceae bacterium]HMY48998.1 rhombotarget lipoprotein [Rhodocyclaceae bacterium]HMZ75236.1 rhombotarget lipoprotein [Rhodocyclaceae bacterium]